jgi:thiamine biosynthesis lipoprotein
MTMGTEFSVQISSDDGPPDSSLRLQITDMLETFEQRFSTYRTESELSQFNRNPSTEWIDVSTELCNAISDALALSKLTGGAFDVSVGSLVNLWGFGPDGDRRERPIRKDIDSARESSGYRKLEANCAHPALRKSIAELYVDLSAYAKGLAVDRVAWIVASRGFENYIVEIGGELRANGTKSDGEIWTIAIESPTVAERTVQRVIGLRGMAVATSGDYRNYFESDGHRYSHLIDPRSGEPVPGTLASVTVIAESTATADAMATALMVLGPVDGRAFAEKQQLAAFFVVRNGGGFDEFMTSAFEAMAGER